MIPGLRKTAILYFITYQCLFTGNYINATLLTTVAIIFFVLIYDFLKFKYETLAMIGLFFIPLYGVLNIVFYSIQISIVPALAGSALGNPAAIVTPMIQSLLCRGIRNRRELVK